jgi:LmeA-like phospholipid-binding
MRGVLAAVIVPVVVVFLIGPYTFLPSLLEYAVARDVQARLGTERRPEVNLESDPALKMLSGEFSDGRIVLKNAVLGGVRAERATIDLDPFDINVWSSMMRGHVVDREPLSGELRIEVSEDEVSRLVNEGSDVPVIRLDVKKDGVVVESEATVLGTRVPVSVKGDLGSRDGNLIFEPQSLEAAGFPVPKELADQLLAGADFEYPLDRLPYRARITGVETGEGRIVLEGTVPSIPLGVYPGG